MEKFMESVQTIKLSQLDIEIGHSLNDISFLVRSVKGVIFDLELI